MAMPEHMSNAPTRRRRFTLIDSTQDREPQWDTTAIRARPARDDGLEHAVVYFANRDYIRTARFYEQSGFSMWRNFMTRDLGQTDT